MESTHEQFERPLDAGSIAVPRAPSPIDALPDDVRKALSKKLATIAKETNGDSDVFLPGKNA